MDGLAALDGNLLYPKAIVISGLHPKRVPSRVKIVQPVKACRVRFRIKDSARRQIARFHRSLGQGTHLIANQALDGSRLGLKLFR
jgi:hypothetical protein